MKKDKTLFTNKLKEYTYSIGFQDFGVSKAEELTTEARNLEKWLSQGLHGEMQYMENHFDMRINPKNLLPGTKSVISLSHSYFPEKEWTENRYKIAKYAYGKDYHKVLKKKLNQIIKWIENELGTTIIARGFVDSGPILERTWAQKSGVGWIGKNSLLLTKAKGSFFFLCEILVDLELEYNTPVTEYCGKCTKCIDACPTQAIIAPYVIDSQKCISYLTIEYKDALPQEYQAKMQDWAFGCDICQDVCPINGRALPHNEPLFYPNQAFVDLNKEEMESMQIDIFNKIFEGSAIKRTKFEGFARNVDFLKPK